MRLGDMPNGKIGDDAKRLHTVASRHQATVDLADGAHAPGFFLSYKAIETGQDDRQEASGFVVVAMAVVQGQHLDSSWTVTFTNHMK
jgi:hypothetical protein